MTLGLKPVTRINYEIISQQRFPGIDSVGYQYAGNGGSYQAYLGMAYGIKHFSIGFNAGYMFGNKEYTTKLLFINDTVSYLKGELFRFHQLRWNFCKGRATVYPWLYQGIKTFDSVQLSDLKIT